MIGHIKSDHDDTKSWCGENLGNDFYFKSADHVVLNGMHPCHAKTCWDCANFIIDLIIKSRDRNE